MYKEYLHPLVAEYIKDVLELHCFTDENDNLCSYSLSGIENIEPEKVIKENCKSKKCNDLLIYSYKKVTIEQLSALDDVSTVYSKIGYNELDMLNDTIEFLESDECKSLQTSGNFKEKN